MVQLIAMVFQYSGKEVEDAEAIADTGCERHDMNVSFIQRVVPNSDCIGFMDVTY